MSDQARTEDPFIGLEPFTEAESDRFFGREAETRILVHKVRANKFTLLVAASGLGKSSLLEAGVKPALRAQATHALLSFRTWYGDPLPELKGALAGNLATPGGTGPVLDPDQSLSVLLRLYALIGGRPLILFLDQFEELFNYQRFSGRLGPLIRELSEAIEDKSAPAHLAISMREDFAMELNAFKPHLGSVFENYYRLEKLGLEQARAAIERPLLDRGWSYEADENGRTLADTLLDDLGHREYRERYGDQPLVDPTDLALQVEPPHLQIVCKTLWELDRGDPNRRLRRTTYERAGGADGILDSHFLKAIGTLRPEERRIASRAFEYLVGQRGTKIAYPVDELADRCRTEPIALDSALGALDRARILRRRERADPATGSPRTWYELYHDVFSRSVLAWNRDFKARDRLRRGILGVAGALLALGVGYLALDLWSNHEGRYLTLSPLAGVSDRIEVHSGAFDLPTDLLAQGRFLYETDRVRGDIESDRRFDRARIADRQETDLELTARLPVIDRLPVYRADGLLVSGFRLARLAVESEASERDGDLIAEAVWSAGLLRHALSLAQVKRIAEGRSGPRRQVAALGWLARLGTEKGHAAIAAQLDDQSPAVRRAAIDGLDRLDAAGFIETVAARLGDRDDDVRHAVADALVRVGAAESSEAVAARLGDGSAAVRRQAIEILGELGAAESIESIAQRLGDEDEQVRAAAIGALAGLGATGWIESIAARLGDTGWKVRRAAIDALVQLGANQWIKAIAARLGDDVAEVRSEAIAALSKLDAPQLIEAIAARLGDDSEDVRNEAIGALFTLGKNDLIEAVTGQLGHHAAYVRRSTIEMLVELQGTQSIKAIGTRLTDDKEYVRSAAIVALGELGATQSIKAIVARLKDQGPYVRFQAIEALVKLGATQSIEAIAERMGDEDQEVRRASIEALVQLGATQSIDAIVGRVGDEDKEVRRAAIEALGQFAATESIEPIAARLGDEDPNVRRAAIEALVKLGATRSTSAVVARLSDEDSDVRVAAIEALVQLGATQSIDAIAESLEAPDEPVRVAAIEALGRLGATQWIDAIAEQVGYVGDSLDVRLGAIHTLGQLGAKWRLVLNDPRIFPSEQAKMCFALGRPWSVTRLVRQFRLAEKDLERTTYCTVSRPLELPAEIAAWCSETAANLSGEDVPLEFDHLGDLHDAFAVDRLAQALCDERTSRADILDALGRIGELSPELIAPHLDAILALALPADTPSIDGQAQAAAVRALGLTLAFRGDSTPEDLPDLDRWIREALWSIPINLDPKDYLISLAALDALGLSGRQESMKRIWDQVKDYEDSKDPIWTEQLYPKALFWIGRIGYPPAAGPLAAGLENLAQAKAEWRLQRDRAERRSREGVAQTATTLREARGEGVRFVPWPHAGLEFSLGYAIARSDPGGRGIDLLGHPLQEVRRAAIEALASWARPAALARVLRRVQDFHDSDLPSPFPTAAYRALDGGLTVMELTGTAKELKVLTDDTSGLCDPDLVAPITEADFERAILVPLSQVQRAACDRLRWTLENADFNSLVRDHPTVTASP